MPKDFQSTIIKIDLQEIATALIRHHKLHEGLWGVYVEFGITAANISMNTPDDTSESRLFPTALVPVKSIGLQTFPEPNDLTVDAAKVNPKPKGKVNLTLPPKRKKGR